jgi:hypothetical protein
MSTFDTKEDLLVTIQTILDSINSGNLNQEEMEVFVSSTRELYERALILRYKAYEQKIYGHVTPEEPVLEADNHEKIVVTPVIESIDPPAEATPFDMSFSLFDQEELTIISEEKNSDDNTTNNGHSNESIEINEVNSEIEEVVTAIENQEAVNELFTSEKSDIVINTTISSTHEEIAIEPITTEKIEISSAPKDLFDKMLNKDNSLGAKLTSTRIESLNGSFGLNEKLQVIHELFDGSSELFYQAIQIFDSLPDFSQAKIVLSNYQQEFSWDLDNALLIEFVQKVARRYA